MARILCGLFLMSGLSGFFLASSGVTEPASSVRRPSGKMSGPLQFSPMARSRVSALSEDRIKQVFEFLKSDERRLAYRRATDGCTERATQTCALLRDHFQLGCGKVWIAAEEGESLLKVPLRAMSAGLSGWRHHVAVFLWSRDAGGVRRVLVLDPVLANQPIEVSDWIRIQTQHDPRLAFTVKLTSGRAQSSGRDQERTNQEQVEIEQRAQLRNEEYWALQQFSEKQIPIPQAISRRIQEREQQDEAELGSSSGL